MAETKGNGHDPATQAIVDVLERIEKQIKATNERLDGTNARLDGFERAAVDRLQRLEKGLVKLQAEVHDFRVETREELLDLRGAQHEDREALEARVAKLEAVVFKQAG